MLKPSRLATHLTLVVLLGASLASAQIPDNNNRGNNNGGGRGGPGGGWGGPGGGGWGGPGGGGPGGGGPGGNLSPAALIVMPVIQDELKMTDKQKEQVTQVNAEAEKKRTQVRENAQKMATAAREQAAMQAAAAAEANGGTPFNAGGNNGNGNNGGGRGGRGNRNDAGAQVMRDALNNFQQQVEAALLKILDSKQKTRIKQIALQAEGAGAFNNPEVIEKLGMTEEQVAAIESIRNESRQNQRYLMGQLFNNGNNNGGPGGGGNNGGPGGGRPDPAMFQTPEFQAKLKTVQEGQEKLDDQTMAAVGKALTKPQRAKFNIMIGDKFDVSQVRRNFMDRFRPGGAAGTQPGQQASAATPAAAPTPAPVAATPAAPAATPATAKPAARKSLREARNGTP